LNLYGYREDEMREYEYKEIVVITAAYAPSEGGCDGCYYKYKTYTSAGHENDPCQTCDDDFIFKKSIRLEKI